MAGQRQGGWGGEEKGSAQGSHRTEAEAAWTHGLPDHTDLDPRPTSNQFPAVQP